MDRAHNTTSHGPDGSETPLKPTASATNLGLEEEKTSARFSCCSSASSSSKGYPHTVQVSQSKASRSDNVTDVPQPGRGARSSTRSSSRAPRRLSGSTAASSMSEVEPPPAFLGKIGVCALDVKARSKPSQNILTRLQSKGDFEVIVFGDKVILDEAVENWPVCDFLIAFFSDGFPLDKAIAYARLRRPFCVNDLPMQKILWDRRLCLRILDHMSVPTPKRIEVNRDGGPTLESPELAQHVYKLTGVKLDGPTDGTGGGTSKTKNVTLSDDGDSLIVDGKHFRKPFVEKPVSGEDHNIHIYFPKDQQYGGGGRRLFRKVGNKSSEYDPDLRTPRSILEDGSSYIYEQFLRVDNAEDVKAYTVGPDFCHAETRKSPVVDGLVRRNTHGKELRYITKLSKEEAILRDIFISERRRREGVAEASEASFSDQSHYPWRHSVSHRHALKTLLKSPGSSKSNGNPQHQRDSDVGSLESSHPSLTAPSHDGMDFNNGHAGVISKEQSASPSICTPQGANQPSPTMHSLEANPPPPASKHSWKLKGMVAVIRHADRTPKQKFKFTFHSQPFIDLLKGHQEEVVIKGESALRSVSEAVNLAMEQGLEDADKLKLLRTSLEKKGGWPGTKVQIKPMFRRRDLEGGSVKTSVLSDTVEKEPNSLPMDAPQEGENIGRSQTRSDSISGATFSRFSAVENDLILDKLQLVIKWGGEPTHAARYQSQDLGLNMRDDLKLMNKEALNNVRVFTSSERRKEIPEGFIQVRKDLLDDSNAAKDLMDKVKKKLKLLLREGSAPSQFTWPKENIPEPSVVLATVVELMKFHRDIMRHNYEKLDRSYTLAPDAAEKSDESASSRAADTSNENPAFSAIQGRWCTGEDPMLFKERWEKLFAEFCDTEKVDPSKLSELYDSMKFDALHNRQFLEWVFTPPDAEDSDEEAADMYRRGPSRNHASAAESRVNGFDGSGHQRVDEQYSESQTLAHRLGLKRRMHAFETSIPHLRALDDSYDHYFKLYPSSNPSKTKLDSRLSKLRELYKLAKVLFDYVTPQEYGITDTEKLEIGLLTSLPLLQEIVRDLEEVQASSDAKSVFYFTKESHIYTLLNCILEGGVQTKIARSAIPELDYLSQICFELYEARDSESSTSSYSIRISISPGCHAFDPLDVHLDSRHAIGCAPRRSLTAHQDWKEVIETLKAKFNTVKLPKSFTAVNLSDKLVSRPQ
ncbi:histidine phosphatase superfamily-domain-containing protein [Aspergillus tetrazonus]